MTLLRLLGHRPAGEERLKFLAEQVQTTGNRALMAEVVAALPDLEERLDAKELEKLVEEFFWIW